jgi:PIN domain nuclease of toxin-antitoxin system
MRLLLDTHTFLWFIYRQPTGERFFQLCLDPENDLYLSAASYWEICIKASLRKLDLTEDWVEVFDRELALNVIHWLPVEKLHCLELLRLPHHHRDPFDRLLVAQARAEGLTVLTADPNFGRYDVPVVW